MRVMFVALIAIVTAAWPSPALAQATTRLCRPTEETGAACLLSRKQLSSLPTGKVFWHLDRFTTEDEAQTASTSTSVVVDSFGFTWLFTLANKAWRPAGGEHVATVGPLPVAPATHYAAEYLRSIFEPGTAAPLHVHSGPEAFFAVSGDTCLETPDGVRTARGPGTGLIIKAGPPMLLMAIGTVARQGFALILHDASQPPTTLTQAWHPQGLCARQLLMDRTRKPPGN